MYSNIFSLIRTAQDRDILLSEIKAVKEVQFEPKTSLESVFTSRLRASVAAIFRTKAEGGALDSYMTGLEAALASLNEVKMTLAREPSEEVVDAISTWLSKNMGENTIFSVTVNPQALGGALVSFQGKYYDGSLEHELAQYFLEQKDGLGLGI